VVSSKVIGMLQERRVELAAIEPGRSNWSKVAEWHTRTRPMIAQFFPQQLAAFDALATPKWVAYPRVYSGGRETTGLGKSEHAANEGVAATGKDRLLAHLDALIELVGIEEETAVRRGAVAVGGKQVFIVHGHNERWVHETARFVEKLGLTPVILREQPNHGRTIIEKFEDVAEQIGFAVVLLTGDDVCRAVDSESDSGQPRARQNVILELGFFLGRLSRASVCALYEDGVEVPSDYSGVLFVPLDETGGWHMLLAREMKAAGLSVDMNKAL
jgi:predicted nucleotide-binding protein